MAAPSSIAVQTLARLIGSPDSLVIIDVRTDDDVELDPRPIAGSERRPRATVPTWACEVLGRPVVIVFRRGQKLSEGAAAWIRHEGGTAESLGGGFEGWRDAGLPRLSSNHVPSRDHAGRTVWVTRAQAACLGLSRMYRDDLIRLNAGLSLYDAFYRWCRDATGEPPNWPASRGGA